MRIPYATKSHFGDFCFEDNGIVVEMIHEGVPELRDDVVERIGGDGSVLRSTRLGTREITLECRAFRDRWVDFDHLRDRISTMLLWGERKLSLRSHLGEYYLAHLTDYDEGERVGLTGIGAFTLTFIAYDPVRYGRVVTATVPSGGTTTLSVGGTYPASLEIAAPAATRSSSTQLWGLRFDEGDFLRLKFPTSTSRRVEIDCSSRLVMVGGVVSMVTLDSNWPVLSPGRHVVRMDQGTGAATLTWQERSV